MTSGGNTMGTSKRVERSCPEMCVPAIAHGTLTQSERTAVMGMEIKLKAMAMDLRLFSADSGDRAS